MEPLDPKAELMRLAVNMAGACIESERLYAVHGGYLSDANLRKRQAAEREAKDKLESAIDQALTDARRLALEDLATELESLNGYVMKDALCTIIRNKARLPVDGKAGAT